MAGEIYIADKQTLDLVKADTIAIKTSVSSIKSDTTAINNKFSAGISSIKSLQKGITSMSSACNIIINTVNPSKCFVVINGSGTRLDTGGSEVSVTPIVASLTSTNLNLTSSPARSNYEVSWQVIEFI